MVLSCHIILITKISPEKSCLFPNTLENKQLSRLRYLFFEVGHTDCCIDSDFSFYCASKMLFSNLFHIVCSYNLNSPFCFFAWYNALSALSYRVFVSSFAVLSVPPILKETFNSGIISLISERKRQLQYGKVWPQKILC